ATLGVVFLSGPMAESVTDFGKTYIEMGYALTLDRAGTGRVLIELLLHLALVLALPLALIIAFGFIGPLVQHGFLWSGESLKPNLAKLNVFAGFGRMFGRRALLEFLKGLAKLSVVGGVAAATLIGMLDDDVEHFLATPAGDLAREIRRLTLVIVFAVLPVLLVIAGFDWFVQRFAFMKQMRMTKQEVKDEFKNTEGDPVIKGRMRQLRMQRARQRMMQNVPKADVVVTNPTHFAVALQYDPLAMAAPRVVAKGADNIALRIREIAEENKVPIVRNPPVARALFAACDIDEDVPADQYRAVAEIISYVFKLKGKKLGG
ncbi:MAG TPA: flagellar type III secretion system protein FlhB, partial [Alphaproteobacteria bacterium]|nr:flagellar type III secretion system protein FlhB [Alphaproteobacteria bacterium]